ncbi:unnamed protein product [Schistosoma mattheei]|uniref:Uncharacterized protein n=1 Tax=Schistosoma mattheei TaxID=31246 RepID=A0A183PWB1_9TREM|nr:unnamed protein product [Schistosoma mattheei]
MSSTVRKSNINKISHSVDDCKESKGNLQEIQDLENGMPNGISIKLQENYFYDVKDLHSLDHSSDQLTKVSAL